MGLGEFNLRGRDRIHLGASVGQALLTPWVSRNDLEILEIPKVVCIL